jgi:myo-inositol-1(or 4)-monophosphatase
MSDLAELRAFAESLAELARAETLPRFRSGLVADNKWDHGFDPVTDGEREAERVIRAAIEARFPEHGILGEELGTKQTDSPWRWVLDPVDGTRAFICGVPTWATLIGLEKDGEPVIGVIDQPYTQERWVGDGERTELVRPEGRRVVRTSGLEDLARARLSTTDPRAEGYFTAEEAAAFAAAAAQARLPRFGYDAYAYGLLACGELDAVAESFLQRYDYAALLPVIRGAGGVVTNWSGGPVSESPRGQLVAAASPALHERLVQVLARAADA